MNTAARMESNGKPGKVHLSGATADLLIASGKEHWLVKREDKIHAKGKGLMQTWFLRGKRTEGRNGDEVLRPSIDDLHQAEEAVMIEEEAANSALAHMDDKMDRLVDWISQSLSGILERLFATRMARGLVMTDTPSLDSGTHKTPREELKDALSFQWNPLDENAIKASVDSLEQKVLDQLKDFVGVVVGRYPMENKYHNADHAAHVLQAALHLFGRMGPRDSQPSCISADPMVVFACCFAALVLDIEHPGVPNTQLRQENPSLASMYKGRSIAEQHSFSVTWDLLHTHSYKHLCQLICPNKTEQSRFRELLITAMMASDLQDRDLRAGRIMRWNMAFEMGTTSEPEVESSKHDILDRQATIVVEHLIQAVAISHTMQHWYVSLETVP